MTPSAQEITLIKSGQAFHEAFLTGNGLMGQAIFGQMVEEQIILTHHAFYSGETDRDEPSAEAPAFFRKARAAACLGDYAAADEAVEGFMGQKENYGTSLPVGTLKLQHQLVDGHHYVRKLEMREGLVETRFVHAGGSHHRAAFCSHPDRVFVWLEEDEALMDVVLSLDGGAPCHCFAQGNQLIFETQALETIHSDGKCGTRLVGCISVDAGDGHVKAGEGFLHVQGSRRWMLTLRMTSDYQLDESEPSVPYEEWFELAKAEVTTPGCRLHDYETLKTRHKVDFSSLMDRFRIRLAGDEVAEYAERMVNLGRYLTVSGARSDASLPMSLQGVWNDKVACRIGWTCDMHLDINTQMNYWLCEQTGLHESHLPLFEWMKKRLIPHGERNARRHYGLSGWAGELVSNAWGYAQPYWNRSLAPCPACGAWQTLDLMTHYRRTGDRAFLHDTALPALRGAAAFFCQYVFADELGTMQTGPSISPENAFLPSNDRHRYNSISPTFEVSMIRAVLSDYVEACEQLEIQEALCDRARKIVQKLPKPQVLQDGTLAEWANGRQARDPQHRHTSHLVGLYPLHEIEAGTPLAEAARKSIQAKLTPYDGWEDTGWARNLLTLYSARLQDADQVHFHLVETQRQLTLENGLVMHPATRGTGTDCPVWELDGNTGVAAAVLEALVQCDRGSLHLLPALPKSWSSGCVEGLTVDGCLTVSMTWQQGSVTIVLESGIDQEIRVRCAEGEWKKLSLQKGMHHAIVFER